MKKAILILLFLPLWSATTVFAQLEGKKFISGSAGLGFNNNNPKDLKASNGYSYNFDVSLGKFKTNNRAQGWTLSNSLGGGKNYQLGDTEETALKGINSFGIGVGHFWHYYKHFSDKFGIFGGPGFSLSYQYAKQLYSPSPGEISDQRNNTFEVSFDLTAGAYYALNDRWWLLGSLGFATPLSAQYSFQKFESRTTNPDFKNNQFEYHLAPSITFPSVSLGLRYFFRN